MSNELLKELLKKYRVNHLHYMSHINNIPLILGLGILSYNEIKSLKLPHYDFSNPEVQEKREREIQGTGRSLHDYVPLYFATHTPTQYVLVTPSLPNREALEEKELAFIELDAFEIFRLKGVIFTDGNATHSEFYFKIKDLERLNWYDIWSPNQYCPTNNYCYEGEWVRRKSSEVLIPDHINVALFQRIIVFDEKIAEELYRKFIRITKEYRSKKLKYPWNDEKKFDYYIDLTHYFSKPHKLFTR